MKTEEVKQEIKKIDEELSFWFREVMENLQLAKDLVEEKLILLDESRVKGCEEVTRCIQELKTMIMELNRITKLRDNLVMGMVEGTRDSQIEMLRNIKKKSSLYDGMIGKINNISRQVGVMLGITSAKVDQIHRMSMENQFCLYEICEYF